MHYVRLIWNTGILLLREYKEERTIRPMPEPPPVTRATLPLTLSTLPSWKSGLLDMLGIGLTDISEVFYIQYQYEGVLILILNR